MSEDVQTIMTDDGPREGVIVPITKSEDAMARITLADGSVVVLRSVVLRAVRLKDEWSPDGMPRYFLSHQTVLAVETAPAALQRV